MRCSLGIALIAALLAGAAPARGLAAHRALDGKARAALRGSSVPVLLPASLPASFGPIANITVISAGRTGYYVGYAQANSCAGGLSCSFFHVAGLPAALRAARGRRDRSVRLADGERGLFRPKDCSGASCSEASLTFERGGAAYEIDAKVARDDLTVLESAYRRMRPVAALSARR